MQLLFIFCSRDWGRALCGASWWTRPVLSIMAARYRCGLLPSGLSYGFRCTSSGSPHTKGVSVENPSPAQSLTHDAEWAQVGNYQEAFLKPGCLDTPWVYAGSLSFHWDFTRNRQGNEHIMLHEVHTVVPAIWGWSAFQCGLHPGGNVFVERDVPACLTEEHAAETLASIPCFTCPLRLCGHLCTVWGNITPPQVEAEQGRSLHLRLGWITGKHMIHKKQTHWMPLLLSKILHADFQWALLVTGKIWLHKSASGGTKSSPRTGMSFLTTSSSY